FITFFAGILIGIAVLYWLIVPTVRSDVKAEYAAKERDYGAEIASYTTTISVLENEKTNLTGKLKETEAALSQLQGEMDSASDGEFDVAAYEQAVLVLMEYSGLEERVKEAEADKVPFEVLDELIAYGEKLLACKDGALLRKKTAEQYEQVYAEVAQRVREYGYDYGHELYNNKKYKDAISYLTAVYQMDGTDQDTLYFLGRSYQRNGDEENARIYLQMLVSQYPESERADMARQCMDGLD
ncbi:MAG: tetratricopeptide repeat protein, partial [Lachnospiraceae bacterium]|nr:tetratricopeptide repeat protein [Lachnospiraceae bacterium]